MTNQALLIFVKNPELGKVKTRLASDVGDEKALAVYLELLKRTEKVTRPLPFDKFVFYSDYIPSNDLFSEKEFQKKIQRGEDLGQRMSNAFKEVFDQGLGPVCIIGSDCYDLQTNHLHEAFFHLVKNDFVVGPAKDGGYYLIGMKDFDEGVFQNIKWSTETVFFETLEYVKGKRKSYQLLQSLRDIDTAEDLEGLKKLTRE